MLFDLDNDQVNGDGAQRADQSVTTDSVPWLGRVDTQGSP